MDDLHTLYVEQKMSIPEISKITGVAQSTIRFRLLAAGILRTRADAIRLAADKGKLGSGQRGKKRVFTNEWKAKLSASKRKLADATAAGTTIKPNGYVEYTRGKNKGRGVHVVVMEKHIGRRLFSFECVHHKDENKQNNDLSNLELMTRAEHARHHALENLNNRRRKENGQFE